MPRAARQRRDAPARPADDARRRRGRRRSSRDVRDRHRMVEVFRSTGPRWCSMRPPTSTCRSWRRTRRRRSARTSWAPRTWSRPPRSLGTERFVLISTDKAVRPASVMGGSKRMAEEIVRRLAGRGTVFCAVRFGNVLGSRGSVVPTFLRQIAAGGPVTVTDPEMTRYFMSVEEAVQLVLQARRSPRAARCSPSRWASPSTSWSSRSKLIRLSGRVPGPRHRHQVVGARPGEKLHEELVDDDEAPVPSGSPGHRRGAATAPRPRGAPAPAARAGGARQRRPSRRARRAAADGREQRRVPGRRPVSVGEAS